MSYTLFLFFCDTLYSCCLFAYACRCACLNWQPASVHSRQVKQAAQHVVAMVNDMTSSHAGLCARLRLDDVMSAVRYVTSDHVLRFSQSSDVHGRVADFSDQMKPDVVRLFASFSSSPSLPPPDFSLETHTVGLSGLAKWAH